MGGGEQKTGKPGEKAGKNGKIGKAPLALLREILSPEGNVLHGELPPPQVVQHPRARGDGEAQLVGAQRLPGLAVAAVHIATAVLSVPQQRAADLRQGDPNLVGSACQQPALHETQPVPALQGAI